MLPQYLRSLSPCILLSLVGFSVGNVLDLGQVESLRIRRDKPSAEQISIPLGSTYRCARSSGPSCIVVTMCQAYGVTDLGLGTVSFTPHRAGNFTCRMSGIERNIVVYEEIVAFRGEVRVKRLENFKLIAPEGGLEASIENVGVEAKDGRLSVYNLPFYDDDSRSFSISIVMENSSIYEVPLRVVNTMDSCYFVALKQITVTRDFGKSDINSFENRMAAFKCIAEQLSDDGHLLNRVCFPEEDMNEPAFPIFSRRALNVGRGTADCFGYSVTHPKDHIVKVPRSSESPRTPSLKKEDVRESTVTNLPDGSEPDGKVEKVYIWDSVFYWLAVARELVSLFLLAVVCAIGAILGCVLLLGAAPLM